MPSSRKVFLVHGRNKPARKARVAFLHSLRLQSSGGRNKYGPPGT